MKNLLLHIRYLVRCHDCVTIPGFGSFIATTLPALVDESRELFMPPARYISFNSEITHNDGLIAASIARRDNISFEAASAAVDKAVELIRHEIATYGTITFPSVGTLKADTQGLITFTPDASADFVNPYSILEPVRFPAKDIIAAGLPEDLPAPKPRIIRIGASAMRIAASVAITVSLGALLFFPLRDSSAIPLVKAAIWPSQTDAPAPAEITINRPEIELLFAEAPADTTACETTAAPADTYGVVVGVFSSADKADIFIAGRENLTCGTDRKGHTRVYAATAATMKECAAAAAQMRASGEWPDAWPARIQ